MRFAQCVFQVTGLAGFVQILSGIEELLGVLGIEHENGVVESLPKTVEDERLKAGVESLLAKHPREAVAIYLHAFNSMNGENWTNLEDLLRTDLRLKLAAGG